jgi:hypothetical protein
VSDGRKAIRLLLVQCNLPHNGIELAWCQVPSLTYTSSYQDVLSKVRMEEDLGEKRGR